MRWRTKETIRGRQCDRTASHPPSSAMHLHCKQSPRRSIPNHGRFDLGPGATHKVVRENAGQQPPHGPRGAARRRSAVHKAGSRQARGLGRQRMGQAARGRGDKAEGVGVSSLFMCVCTPGPASRPHARACARLQRACARGRQISLSIDLTCGVLEALDRLVEAVQVCGD